MILISLRAKAKFSPTAQRSSASRKILPSELCDVISLDEESNAARKEALKEAKKALKTQIIKNVLDGDASSKNFVPIIDETASGAKSLKLVPKGSVAAKASRKSLTVVASVYTGASLILR